MNLDHDGLPNGRKGRTGFTLLELMVVIVTLAVLSALLLPAMASTKPNSKVIQCLNNQKQLALAWLMYASDNSDQLAINSDASVPYKGTPSWISGWMDWTASQVNTNTDDLVKDTYSLLGGYLGRNYRVFACPATASFVSSMQAARGWNNRARSVTMDAALGDGNKFNVYGPQWYVAKKVTDLHSPGPSDVYVFLDEHPDSIDDGIFYTPNTTSNTPQRIIEHPGNQHAGACGVSFADGHSEMHKWQGRFSSKPVTYTYAVNFSVPVNDPDMLWLANHTPVK